MNIIVCIKQTLDTAAKVEIIDGRVCVEGVPRIINPYDEYAIEEALRIKENIGATQITLITVGPKEFSDSLRTGLAMGADFAVHVLDSAFEGLNGVGVAKVLTQVIQSRPFDLILCGRQAVDDDMAQVGPALATLLDISFITVVTKFELSEDSKQAVVTRQIEGGAEVLEVSLPVLLTCQKGLNEPRLPSLKGIMKSKKKEIKTLDALSLGLNPKTLVCDHTNQINLTLPPGRKKGIILKGSVQETASLLAGILRDDVKVI